MKVIQIEVSWPTRIDARDNEGQTVTVIRDPKVSDNDEATCDVFSRLIGDETEQHGTVKWVDAFKAIQRMFNATSN